MDIADTTEPKPAEEDKKKQSSDGGACAEDKQGGPSGGGVATASPAAPKEKKVRIKKVVMEKPKSSIDIDSDPLFFAKLNHVSKRIAQDARRHRLSSLPIV